MERVYVRNLYRIGGSLGITLPNTFSVRKELKVGTRVVITEENNRVLIETVNSETLKKLERKGKLNKINGVNKT